MNPRILAVFIAAALGGCRMFSSEDVIVVSRARTVGCGGAPEESSKSEAQSIGVSNSAIAAHNVAYESDWTTILVRNFSVGDPNATDDEGFDKVSISVSDASLASRPTTLAIPSTACALHTVGPVHWPDRACLMLANQGQISLTWHDSQIVSVSIHATGESDKPTPSARCPTKLEGSWTIESWLDSPGADAWLFGAARRPWDE